MISKSIDHLIAQQFYFVICLWSLLVILNCTSMCEITHWWSELHQHILKKPSDCKVSGFWIELNCITASYWSWVSQHFRRKYEKTTAILCWKWSNCTDTHLYQIHRLYVTLTGAFRHACFQNEATKWHCWEIPLKHSSGIMGKTSFLITAREGWKYTATHL